MIGTAQALRTPTLPLTARPEVTRRGLCLSLAKIDVDGIFAGIRRPSCEETRTQHGRAKPRATKPSADALVVSTPNSESANRVGGQQLSDTTKTAIPATTTAPILRFFVAGATWPQTVGWIVSSLRLYPYAVRNPQNPASSADGYRNRCGAVVAMRATNISVVTVLNGLTSTTDAESSSHSQKCHLAYDAEHHQRNAAETRRRQKIEDGQGVLL